jgi:quercetin dioxygenase-like cupin family protein
MTKLAAERSGPFSSADFWRVPDKLNVRLPDKLIHRAVMQSHTAGSDSFSGERRHPVQIVDLPSRTMSMTLGGLLPGQTTRCHRHNYETLLYVCKGKGMTFIEGQPVEWEQGDAVYIPVWAWHYHKNRSDENDCLYIACENAPLLQNLGEIALREEQS